MKRAANPKSGRADSIVYLKTRYGYVAREYVPPRNLRTASQQGNRASFGAVSSRWRTLTLEQRAAWRGAAADKYLTTKTGRRIRHNGYSLFVGLNARRAELGLPLFDLPPAEPVFGRNPVTELVITNTGGQVRLKLRVPSPPAQYTVVQGAAPASRAARFVLHYPFLGLLPEPLDGWSDITDLYVAHYGVPKACKAVWIRTCQHIDGWTDAPKVTRARVPQTSV
jgi:hypothetical protein